MSSLATQCGRLSQLPLMGFSLDVLSFFSPALPVTRTAVLPLAPQSCANAPGLPRHRTPKETPWWRRGQIILLTSLLPRQSKVCSEAVPLNLVVGAPRILRWVDLFRVECSFIFSFTFPSRPFLFWACLLFTDSLYLDFEVCWSGLGWLPAFLGLACQWWSQVPNICPQLPC